jgi:hypothetical protein
LSKAIGLGAKRKLVDSASPSNLQRGVVGVAATQPFAVESGETEAEQKLRAGARIEALRAAMLRYASDVDSRVIALRDEELSMIPAAMRLGLIEQIAQGTIVANEDEDSLIRLLATTPNDQISTLAQALQANNGSLLRALEASIDFSEYSLYHAAIGTLFMRAVVPEELFEQIRSARVLPWSDPGIVRAWSKPRFYYEEAELTDQGKVRITCWMSPPGVPFGLKIINGLELDPDQVVNVQFFTEEDEVGAKEGDVRSLPAINMVALARKQFRGHAFLVADVAAIASGVGGMAGSASQLRRIIAAAELTFGSVDVAVRDYRAEIEALEHGKEFLSTWHAVSALVAVYGVTRLVLEMPRAIGALRNAWERLRISAQKNESLANLRPVEEATAKILATADEISLSLTKERLAQAGLASEQGEALAKSLASAGIGAARSAKLSDALIQRLARADEALAARTPERAIEEMDAIGDALAPSERKLLEKELAAARGTTDLAAYREPSAYIENRFTGVRTFHRAKSYLKLHHGTQTPPEQVLREGFPARGSSLDLEKHQLGDPNSAFRGGTEHPGNPHGDGAAAGFAGDGGWVYEILNPKGWDLNKILQGKIQRPDGTFGGSVYTGETEVAILGRVLPSQIGEIWRVKVRGGKYYIEKVDFKRGQ